MTLVLEGEQFLSEMQPDGTTKKVKDVRNEVISVAIIQSALGKRFQITGLSSLEEAKNLALLCRHEHNHLQA